MKRVGIIAKPDKKRAANLIHKIAKWLSARDIEVYVDEEHGKGFKTLLTNNLDKIELVIVLGGDGTILYANHLIGGRKIPILGVNLGTLGFLTGVTPKEVYPILEDIIKGRFEVEERMMLSVTINKKDGNSSNYTVLNDAAIKGTKARLISLEVRINREHVTTYKADGLIVATPTGSTAYSLSAGGPILYPTIHSVIVSPVCPFTLTNKPIVIPDWMMIEVVIKTRGINVLLTLDGQKDILIEKDDIIEVKRADSSTYLVKCPKRSYFEILRTRLLWAE